MARIGGTYWNASGYWRGNLTANSYLGTNTLQDLLNRTYHIGMTSTIRIRPGWPALDACTCLGRLVLTPSTEATLGAAWGMGRRWESSRDQRRIRPPGATRHGRIGGAFVNFEGGSYDDFRYSSTSGIGVSPSDGRSTGLSSFSKTASITRGMCRFMTHSRWIAPSATPPEGRPVLGLEEIS